MSTGTRRSKTLIHDSNWLEECDRMNDDVYHIDITGGEPLLEWEELITVIEYINRRWPRAFVQILTNGRALCINEIQKALKACLTDNILFAIPIHGHCKELHNAITQSPCSFQQTITGLEYLKAQRMRVEIRIVGQQLNADYILDICRLIIELKLKYVRVNLMAMEMNGNAAKNRTKLWIDYRELYKKSEKGIKLLLLSGIDVVLYNFPLCSLPRNTWYLAKQSITDWKVCYYDDCEKCVVKDVCCGLFKSTYLLNLYRVEPIEEE